MVLTSADVKTPGFNKSGRAAACAHTWETGSTTTAIAASRTRVFIECSYRELRDTAGGALPGARHSSRVHDSKAVVRCSIGNKVRGVPLAMLVDRLAPNVARWPGKAF